MNPVGYSYRRVGVGLVDVLGVVALGVCRFDRGARARGRRFQTGLTAADIGAAFKDPWTRQPPAAPELNTRFMRPAAAIPRESCGLFRE